MHCCFGPSPAPSFPRLAHALTCSQRAPPAPLLLHSAGRRPTNAHLCRSCAAVERRALFPSFLRVAPPAPDPPPPSFSPCGAPEPPPNSSQTPPEPRSSFPPQFNHRRRLVLEPPCATALLPRWSSPLWGATAVYHIHMPTSSEASPAWSRRASPPSSPFPVSVSSEHPLSLFHGSLTVPLTRLQLSGPIGTPLSTGTASSVGRHHTEPPSPPLRATLLPRWIPAVASSPGGHISPR
jgi:hypothetical protein